MDRDNNYNVDDILSEIKSRKSREKAGTPPPPKERRPAPPPEASSFAPPPDPASFAPPPQQEEPFYKEEEFGFDMAPEPPKRRQNPMDFTGHVRPLTDKAKMRPTKLNRQESDIRHLEETQSFTFQQEEAPPAPAPTDNVVDFRSFRARDKGHENTRVLPNFGSQGQPESPEAPPDDGYYEDYSDYGQEQAPPVAATGSFGRISDNAADGYYEEDYEDNTPQHSAIDFSEYNSVEDRRDVATDIARVKLWLFIRGAVTLLLTFFLFWFSLSGKYPAMPMPDMIHPVPETMRAFLIACTALTGVLALVNSSSIGGGLISLFKMRANSDSLAALAVLATIAQAVAGIVKPEIIDPEMLNLYFPLAGLTMLFGILGKTTMINRIQTNFRIISSDRKKKALFRVEDNGFCREFVPDAVRRPTIAYAVRAEFFTDFLGLSYSDKYDVGINRAVAPVCLLGSIVVGAACFMLTGSTLSAVSAFSAILCVSATLSATFVENIPLGKLTKKLAPMGGMVSGNKAVEDFCDAAAVVLTETDLFPEGNVRLRGIKTFSQGRIDESIVDAASVICSLEGALSPVFMQMIGGNKKLLKKVDNIVFENGMGVSAWVDSRRVLIGNRLLMQNHGITLPPDAVRQVQTRAPEDGELLYLSSSGEVTAQFAVSYHIDDDLASQLDIFAAREKQLIVHANDANITPHRIWELYGYPEELISILPAERHAQYREMITPRESAIAEIVYTGRASTLVASLIACMNARSSILSATIVQLIQIVLGYGLIAFMAFMGAIGHLTIVQMSIYQLFWFVVIFIVQKIRQP